MDEAAIEEDVRVAEDASKCVFWCAVAVGGLLQGRPPGTVSRVGLALRLSTPAP